MKKFKRVGTYDDGTSYTKYYLAETAADVVEASTTPPDEYKGSVQGFEEDGSNYSGWFSRMQSAHKIEVTALEVFPFANKKKQSILKKIEELRLEASKL